MDKESEQCFYCGALVKEKNMGDHFPIPKHCGGKESVVCCKSCHQMKDSFTLESWPTEWLSKVLSDMPKMSRETKIFLAKAIRLFAEYKKNVVV